MAAPEFDKGTLARTLIGPCGQVTGLPDRRQAYGPSPLVKFLHSQRCPAYGHRRTTCSHRAMQVSGRHPCPRTVGAHRRLFYGRPRTGPCQRRVPARRAPLSRVCGCFADRVDGVLTLGYSRQAPCAPCPLGMPSSVSFAIRPSWRRPALHRGHVALSAGWPYPPRRPSLSRRVCAQVERVGTGGGVEPGSAVVLGLVEEHFVAPRVVTYLETAPGSDELRVVHLDQHATAEQIRRAADRASRRRSARPSFIARSSPGRPSSANIDISH